jgi:site-specific recombinase XerD
MIRIARDRRRELLVERDKCLPPPNKRNSKGERDITGARLADLYREEVCYSLRSGDCRRVHLENFCKFYGDRIVREMNQLDIERYKRARKGSQAWRAGVGELDKILSGATVNRELATLSHMFKKAIQWGFCDHNTVKGVKRFKENPPVERFLSYEEEKRIFSACNETLKASVTAGICIG